MDRKGTVCIDSKTPIIGMVIKTPLGEYFVEVCGNGAHSVNRANKALAFKPDLSVNVMESNPVECTGAEKPAGNKKSLMMLQRLIQWFHYYFSDPVMFEKTFPNPFEICVPTATEFQKDVWKTLQERAPTGGAVSYGELANYVNRPRAARAVGSAMKNNPNCIIVPCHRVIKSTSEIGNYNGGVDIKEWLLNYEKEMRNGPAMSG